LVGGSLSGQFCGIFLAILKPDKNQGALLPFKGKMNPVK
jgi:hypothetical protein